MHAICKVLPFILGWNLLATSPEIAQASNSFADTLFCALNTREKNALFSPLSVNAALYMAYMGARGETQSQMQSTLHLPSDPNTLAQAMQAYMRTVEQSKHHSASYSFNLVNGMWIDDSLTVLRPYKETIKDAFAGCIRTINFAQPQKAAQTINEVIQRASNNTISDFLHPSDIAPTTRLMLTNTAYLRAKWRLPFDEKQTRKALFHPHGDQKPAMIPTMFQTAHLPYYENETLQAIALPIHSEGDAPKLEYLCILPKNTHPDDASYDAIKRSMRIDALRQKMKTTSVRLALPKYCASFKTPLREMLQTIGLSSPFSPRADFSGITGKKDLFIASFLHECTIDVNERGLLASAASDARFDIKMAAEEPKEFVANHPFVYAIFDTTNELLLFLGAFDSPQNTPSHTKDTAAKR